MVVFAGLAMSACMVDPSATDELFDSGEYASENPENWGGTAAKSDIPPLDRSTRSLALDVIRILKHQEGDVPSPLNEPVTMERFREKVRIEVHAENIRQVKAYYQAAPHWYRETMGWTGWSNKTFDDLSTEEKSIVLADYQGSPDYWDGIDESVYELAAALDEITPCLDCALPRNAAPLVYYTQFLAFRAYRAGIYKSGAINTSMLLDSMQRNIELKFNFNENDLAKRTGIKLPARPSIERPY
jgi:hypothetical protein